MRSNPPRRFPALSLAVVAVLLLSTVPTPVGAAPVITSISDSGSTTNGGVPTTIVGSDFDAASVTFGGTEAVITAQDDDSIDVIVPPRSSAGTVNVVVTNQDGTTAQFTNGFTYTSAGTPTITSIDNTADDTNGGVRVTLEGTNFFRALSPGAVGLEIRIGGFLPANTLFDGCGVGTLCTEISFDVPPHSPGAKDVVIVNPDGKSVTRANGFTYTSANEPIFETDDPPILPISGPASGGTSLQIRGSNFAEGAVVRLGGAIASITSFAQHEIVVTTPPQAAGPVDVVVTNPSGDSVRLADGFTYNPIDPPTLESPHVDPTSGPTTGGSRVEITGTNFHPDAQFTFGGVPALVESVAGDGSSAVVITPSHTAGNVAVRVTNPDGKTDVRTPSTGNNVFTYVNALRIALITSPEGSRDGGNTVTIHGQGFAADALVTFDGQPALLSSGSGTSITATVPPSIGSPMEFTTDPGHPCYVTITNNCYRVDVKVTNPSGESAELRDGYAYKQSAEPTISAVCQQPSGTACTSTGSEHGGNTMHIRGTNFHTSPRPTVLFDGQEATVTAATSTVITVIVPPRDGETAVDDSVDVKVTNPGGRPAPTDGAYTYSSVLAPTVATLTPASGSENGGFSVVIGGQNFLPSARVTVGTQAPVTGSEATDTLTATAHGFSSGRLVEFASSDTLPEPLQERTIYVVRNAMTDSFQVSLTETGALIDLTSAGTGTHTVVGRAPIVGTPGSTSIQVTMPPHTGPTGPTSDVPVRVVHPSGESSSALFDYNQGTTPTLQATPLSPNSASALGGSTMTISGSNFHTNPKPTVTFGGIKAAVGTVTSTSISVTVPASNTLGQVLLVVTNPGGEDVDTVFTYNAPTSAPQVTGVTPSTGPASGGTLVTITGSNFARPGPEATGDDMVKVTIGGVLATDVTVVSGSQITARTGAGMNPALTQVTVANPSGGSGPIGNAFTAIAAPGAPPTLDPIVPADCTVSTNGGQVELTGTFADGFAVLADGAPARWDPLAVPPAALLPAGGPGARTITVVNPDGQSVGIFRACPVAIAPAPLLETWEPTAGPATGGTVVTIVGKNFADDTVVSFGAFPATHVDVVSDTQLKVRAPAHSSGTADLTITNPDGKSASVDDAFGFVGAGGPAAATVTSVSPNSGPSLGGTSVTITGTGFATGATVTFGGVAATSVVRGSASSITAVTPPHAVGAVDVVVTNPGASAGTLNDGFTYTASNPPTVSSVTPDEGSTNGGTSVTIAGTNFANGATVSFGGTEATSVTFTSSTSLTAVTPARTTAGAVDVTVTNPDNQEDTLDDGFTYEAAPPPTVTSLSPQQGPSVGGTSVTIVGTGFSDGATVSFGGRDSPTVAVASNGNSLTATTPGHPAGSVTLVVTNPDGQSASVSGAFSFTPSAAPTITSVTPTTGPTAGGTAISITGTGFADGASVRIGAAAATDVTVTSATQITARTPPGTSGAKDVQVINPDDQTATLANAFTYGTGSSPSTAQIAAANERLQDSVDVSRDGDDNVITFSLSGISPAPQGIQVWRSTSPFVVIAELTGTQANAGEYVDEGAPSGAYYILTVFYSRDAAGGFVDTLSDAPGYEGTTEEEQQAMAAQIGTDGGIPWVVWLIGGLVLLAIIVVVVVVVATRRRAPERDDRQIGWVDEDWDALPPEEPEEPEPTGPVQTFHITCPRCHTDFDATGTKPLTTHCPSCGVEGTLR